MPHVIDTMARKAEGRRGVQHCQDQTRAHMKKRAHSDTQLVAVVAICFGRGAAAELVSEDHGRGACDCKSDMFVL